MNVNNKQKVLMASMAALASAGVIFQATTSHSESLKTVQKQDKPNQKSAKEEPGAPTKVSENSISLREAEAAMPPPHSNTSGPGTSQ